MIFDHTNVMSKNDISNLKLYRTNNKIPNHSGLAYQITLAMSDDTKWLILDQITKLIKSQIALIMMDQIKQIIIDQIKIDQTKQIIL